MPPDMSPYVAVSDLSINIRYHIYDYASWYDSRTTTAWVECSTDLPRRVPA